MKQLSHFDKKLKQIKEEGLTEEDIKYLLERTNINTVYLVKLDKLLKRNKFKIIPKEKNNAKNNRSQKNRRNKTKNKSKNKGIRKINKK